MSEVIIPLPLALFLIPAGVIVMLVLIGMAAAVCMAWVDSHEVELEELYQSLVYRFKRR